MKDDKIEVARLRDHLIELNAVRRGIDELRTLDESGRLGEPCRIPKGLDFTTGLVTGAGAAIEAVEGRSLQKKGPHHGVSRLRSGMRLPSDVTR